MTFGSIIEADRRLRIHGAWQRQQKKVLRDAEVWRRDEEDFAVQGANAAQTQNTEQVTNEKKE